MSAVKPPLRRLSELRPGEQADFFAVLLDRARGVTREGKPYLHCRFADLRRVASFMAWGDDRWFAAAERDWQPGQFFKLRAVYDEHEKYGPQVELLKIRPVEDADKAEGFDPSLLVEASAQEPPLLLGELQSLATRHIANEPLRALVLRLLEEHAEGLLRLPATRDRAFAYPGGWLEHTVNVTRLAVDLAERYAATYPRMQPPLNRDLVAAAAILHDIGRVEELDEAAPVPGWTVPGKLVGPAVLGRDLVRAAAAGVGNVEPDLVLLLEHLLLVPLLPPAEGGSRWPMVPEGLIVQHADDLDLQMALYVRCLRRDGSGGPFTDRDPALQGRQLLKARGV